MNTDPAVQFLPTDLERTESRDVFSWLGGAWGRIPPSSKLIFGIAMIANLASYGFIFSNLTLNHDGFGAITAGGSTNRVTGRWVGDIIYSGLLGGYELIWLYDLIGAVLFIFTAFSICRILQIKEFSVRLTVVLLYTLFPYVCNYYAYAFYVPVWGVAMLLAISAVEYGLAPLRWSKLTIGALFITISLASDQAFIASSLTLTCVLMASMFAEAEDLKEVRRALLHGLPWLVGMIGVGAFAYALSVKISTVLFGVKLIDYQGANSMLSFNAASILKGMQLAIAGTTQFLGFPSHGYENPYFTGSYKYMCSAVLLLAVLGLWAKSKIKIAGFLSIVFLALGALAPRTLQILHPNANYHELTLGGYSILLCGAFAIALRLANRILRSAVQLVVIILVAGFIHSNNVAALSLTMDYQATMHWANRVLARVEAHPKYVLSPAAKQIVFVGDGYRVSQWFYRGPPFVSSVGIADGVPNIIFDSLLRLLHVNITAYGVSPESQKRALEYAASHRAWPAQDAVTVLDDGTIVVVLENARLYSPPAAPPPAETSQATAQPDGPAPVRQHLTAPAFYNLEVIGKVVGPFVKQSVPVAVSDPLTLSGWAADGVNKRTADGVEVLIDGKHYRAQSGLDRPDVAAYFKVPAYGKSGFRFVAPPKTFSAGKHVLSIRILVNDSRAYFEGSEVSVEIR